MKFKPELKLIGLPLNKNENIWASTTSVDHGQESGDTLSLIVEPNWGPPLR